MEKPVLKLVGPGEGRALSIAGGHYTFKAEGAETGGTYTLIEAVVPPGSGPPPHMHAWEVEGFYILEGALSFEVGGQTLAAPSGTFVQAPPGIPHSFNNPGPEPAKVLMWILPGGIEKYFTEIGRLPGTDSHFSPDDVANLQASASKYGITILEKSD